MSTVSAVTNLGAELVVFVAATSLFLLAVSRAELLGARGGSRGFVEVGAALLVMAAVVQGAAVDVEPTAGWLIAVRLAGVALLGIGALPLRNRVARTALFGSALLFLGGELAYQADAITTGNVVRGFGGMALGAAAAVGARRSIAVRIAAAATALLLLVVLVLSAVLSAVLTGNIASEALERAQERARIEAGIVGQQADFVVGQADLLAGILAPSDRLQSGMRTGDFEPLRESMEALQSAYRQVDFIAFVDAQGSARVGVDVDQTSVIELAGGQVVADALAGTQAASVEFLSGGLVALGAAPISVGDERGAPELAGVAVAGNRLNTAFLDVRLQDQRATTFALVAGGRVAATSGEEAAETAIADVVGEDLTEALESQVLGAGTAVSAETSVGGVDRFVAVYPVLASDGRPVAAFVVSQESSLVGDTRASLFRTLFLVALAAATMALLFAVIAGARVAAPVRRLTDAARRISEGDLSARAGIEADDEIGVLGTSFDSMTDSIERMTREIREAAAQTEAILGGMAEGLVAADASGTVVAVNPAAEEMLGAKEGRLLGKQVGLVVKGADRGGKELATRLSAPMRRAWSTNVTLSRRRGPLAVAMSGSPIRNERGEVIGGVYVMRDIQREAEVEAMKTEFLSNISHELRTPLTPIKGYAEMLISKEVPTDRAKLFLQNILDGAERLERYVDMLVNFSAMEAGRFTLQTEEVDVGALARRVGARWASSTDGHRVDVKISSRLPQVVADERLLERALNELMDNAVKYSPDGGTITLSARARGTGKDRRVEIAVADRGIGIDAESLEGIFSDFAQLDGSSTRRYGGLGLGLSFVDRVIKAQHGTLGAESEDGKGSVFTISLPPATPAPRPATRSERTGAKGSDRAGSGRRGRQARSRR